MEAAGKQPRAVERPQVGDLLDHAEQPRRRGAGRGRCCRGRWCRHCRRSSRSRAFSRHCLQRAQQRLQRRLALLHQVQHRAPRRARAEAREAAPAPGSALRSRCDAMARDIGGAWRTRASSAIEQAPCGSSSWERPDFAVPTLDALVEAGHEVVAVYTQPPRPAGRGKALRAVARAASAPRRAGHRGAHARRRLRGAEEQEAFAALDARCRGGRGLRADPAAADPRRADARLPQRPRLAAAALARRGADPARDPGRRRDDRRHHHADGSAGSTPGRCCSSARSRSTTRTPAS